MAAVEQYDAIIIGAGMAGMYQLYRLRELGMSIRVYETGTDLGGTWYWNRYPGARFDSESYTYGYSFSDELLEEWEWSEHFAAQPETLRYLDHVAKKFDLRRDIQFNTRITSAVYDELANHWTVTTAAGAEAEARLLITALGPLSAPYIPDFKGIDSFAGDSWHTSEWPHHEVDFSDQRVGVIGTGATAVQLITEVAKNVGHLTVFQRTPNFVVPSGNGPIDAATQAEIKISYAQMFAQCHESFGEFLHKFDQRSALDVSPEEREAFFEKLWADRGFSFWLANFHDVLTSLAANELIAEFVRKKMRARINDPEVAKKLIPTNHPFGTKRVPLEAGYLEAFNRDNVLLVDLHAQPIERITARGVKTSDQEYEFDVLVYATGFDAVTGALTRIDIRGTDGQGLKDKWADGPSTYLGLQTVGFPNLFTIGGPHNAGTFCNVPRCIEQNVEWITACIRHMRENKLEHISAKPESEAAWTQHVEDLVAPTLIPHTASWFMGANIPGKKRKFLLYAGGAPAYRQKCAEEAASGYQGFELR